MSNFTPEDLLEYYYQETSPEKTDDIAIELAQSWPLRQKFDVIKQAAERLDKSTVSPRIKSLDFLLDYAAKLLNTASVK